MVDADGVYRKTGPARVFTTRAGGDRGDQEPGPDRIKAGDVLVLICRGPMGAGMEEIYQITAALKHLPFGKHVAVLTDARFSGVSTGACIGHVGPEALAGGPIGKLGDGDRIRIVDRPEPARGHDRPGRRTATASRDPEEGARVLAGRPPRPDLAPDPDLPPDTRLWAALQAVGGGTWGGCVYDVDAITEALGRGTPLSRRPLGGVLLLAALTVLWGSNWPAIKLAVRELDPWTFRTICLLVGGGGLLALVRAGGHSLAVPRAERGPLALAALFNITAWHLCSAYGLTRIQAGRGAIIAYTMPLWTVIFGRVLLGERIGGARLAALALGLAGMAVLIAPDARALWAAPAGTLLMLAAAVAWAIGTVLTKATRWTMSTAALTGWQVVLGGIPIALGAALRAAIGNDASSGLASVSTARDPGHRLRHSRGCDLLSLGMVPARGDPAGGGGGDRHPRHPDRGLRERRRPRGACGAASCCGSCWSSAASPSCCGGPAPGADESLARRRAVSTVRRVSG